MIIKCWNDICITFAIPKEISDVLLNQIIKFYQESHRQYHTLSHINSLLHQSKCHELLIRNKFIVNLAIIFHDIIYDPRKSDNEEASNIQFNSMMSSLLPEDIVTSVNKYILATKYHQVQESNDSDLQLFIDMDMSILGSPWEEYIAYARNIRQEYSHVMLEEYCIKRSSFLKQISEKRLFVTNDYYNLYEQQAQYNMKQEYLSLDQFQIL